MSWGIVASVGGAIIGGAISSNGAKSAANTQAGAAQAATDAQERMFNKQVELQEPWRKTGEAGLNRLSFLLGLKPETAAAGGAGPSQLQMETAAQIRQRLTPQFTTNTAGNEGIFDGGGPSSSINQGALDAAVVAELQKQQAAQQAAQAAAANPAAAPAPDPAFGSLMRNFGMSDFNADPGYQFRQEEGLKGVERSAAARGGLMSGKALKDTMRFSQGLATDEYGKAYDRFNNNNNLQFNRLASISGVGQTAANNVGAAASNFGSQMGSNIIGAGNAMAAGQVGSANGLAGGINRGISSYQQQNMMNKLFSGGGGYGGGGYGGGSPPNPYYGQMDTSAWGGGWYE